LADFGLARMVVSAGAMAALESWTWMAPETRGASRVAYDERADVYSYAMLLYHLVIVCRFCCRCRCCVVCLPIETENAAFHPSFSIGHSSIAVC
jgi:serine/threonine protein kinase